MGAAGRDHASPDPRVRHRRLIDALKWADLPGVDLVNENKLRVDDKVSAQRLAVLGDWLGAGCELSNHACAPAGPHVVGIGAPRRSMAANRSCPDVC